MATQCLGKNLLSKNRVRLQMAKIVKKVMVLSWHGELIGVSCCVRYRHALATFHIWVAAARLVIDRMYSIFRTKVRMYLQGANKITFRYRGLSSLTNPIGDDSVCRWGWFGVAAKSAELALVHQVDQLTYQVDDVIFVTSWVTNPYTSITYFNKPDSYFVCTL